MTDEEYAALQKYVPLMGNVHNHSCYSHSGGAIYHGQHWGPFAQASSYTSGQPYLGALAQQTANQANLAQQAATQLARNRAVAQLHPKPEPLEDAGISTGEIIGYRAWRVHENTGLLQSMAVDTVWAPGEPMEGDPDSYSGNSCGVHAFKSASQVFTEYLARLWTTDPIAVGTVALWGSVIEHEFGYRAEFGRVNSIDNIYGEKPHPKKWLRKPKPSMLDTLRQLYGVVS